MSSAITAAILFVCVAGVALLGRRVRRYLPEDHLSGDSKDAVKLALGLVATMTALLLGLLVSSAKGTYDTMRSESDAADRQGRVPRPGAGPLRTGSGGRPRRASRSRRRS